MSDYFYAVCKDDHCPWKYRGTSERSTVVAAQRHADDIEHDVAVVTEHHWTLTAQPSGGIEPTRRSARDPGQEDQ